MIAILATQKKATWRINRLFLFGSGDRHPLLVMTPLSLILDLQRPRPWLSSGKMSLALWQFLMTSPYYVSSVIMLRMKQVTVKP